MSTDENVCSQKNFSRHAVSPVSNQLMSTAINGATCSSSVYIGVDIGGTKLMVTAIDECGEQKSVLKAPTPEECEAGIQQINQMIEQVAQEQKILGIGAAIGGPLDPLTGVVSPVHQPAWRNFPLKQVMEDRWQCPFHVDVDTNVAALGEYHLGGYDESKFLYMTLSTGVGAGFLIDGQIYRGLSHPEVGHQAINHRVTGPGKVSCDCGLEDCLEGIVSGTGIRRIYQQPAEQLKPSQWLEVGYNLGLGLRNIAAILSPQIIVLGGGVSIGGGQMLVSQASQVMQEHLKLVTPPILQLSKHGYNTALIGACYIAANS